MTSYYDIGDVAVRSVKVRDSTGALANAGAVAAVLTLPDLTTKSSPADFTVTNTGTGMYQFPWPITAYGLHQVVWTATGANASGYGETFYVEAFRSAVALDAIKDHLNKNGVLDVSDDEELRRVAVVATTAVEDYTGRDWAPRTQTFTFSGSGEETVVLPMGVATVTSVTENGVALAGTGYTFEPRNGILYRSFGPYTFGSWRYGVRNIVVVTSTGSTTIPAPIRQAVLEVVRELWNAAASESVSPTADLVSELGPGYPLPPRIQQLLNPYRLPASA